MKILKTLLLVLVLLVPLTSCKKSKPVVIAKLVFDDDKLPIIANNGQNYFGFLIDGKPVWRQKKSSMEGGVKAIYIETEGEFRLGLSSTDDQHSVYIDVDTVLKAGETYELKGSNSKGTYFYTESINDPNSSTLSRGYMYVTSDTNLGNLKILYLDTQKKIIAGVFEFYAGITGLTTPKRITKGRFDITYKTSKPIIF